MQATQHLKRTDRAFWHHSPDVMLAELDTRLTGLSEAEAAERLRIYGLNLFEAVHREAFLVKLGKRVLNPLVALLIAAAAVPASAAISAAFSSLSQCSHSP